MVREKKPKIVRDKLKDAITRDIWKLFEVEEEIEERKKNHDKRIIKDRIIRDISTLFEQQENYYEPKRVTNFWNNNYIKYESNGDKNVSIFIT